MALINAGDAAGASEFELDSIKVYVREHGGKKWLIANFSPRRWLRINPEARELPVLPIPTMPWVEATAGH